MHTALANFGVFTGRAAILALITERSRPLPFPRAGWPPIFRPKSEKAAIYMNQRLMVADTRTLLFMREFLNRHFLQLGNGNPIPDVAQYCRMILRMQPTFSKL